MNQRVHNAVVNAQSAFWAEIAKAFPEIKTGDFPPEAQLVFDSACVSAATLWVESNRDASIQGDPRPEALDAAWVDGLMQRMGILNLSSEQWDSLSLQQQLETVAETRQ